MRVVGTVIAVQIGVLMAPTHLGSRAFFQADQVFRSGVSLRTMDVTVLDAERRPVHGLQSEDFIVTEDGVPQVLSTLTEVTVPGPNNELPSWMREVGSDVATNVMDGRRLVTIVLNDGEIFPQHIKLAKATAHAIIDQLGILDLASVFHTYQGPVQNFTADRRQLRAAVDGLLPQRFGPPPVACVAKPLRICGPDVLERVATIVKTGPAGRKMVFLIGPPLTIRNGRQDFSSLGPWQDLVNALQAANATVYEFDPSGLTVAKPDLSNEFGLSEATGGRIIRGTNTPEDLVPRIFTEGSRYYLLGYVSSNARTDGRFRRVKIEVRRPGVEVVARAGYFAPRDARAPAPRSVSKPEEDALGNGLPSGELSLTATAAALASPDRRTADITAVIRLREPLLVSGRNGSTSREVRTIVAAFDKGGRSRGIRRSTFEIDLPPGPTGVTEYEMATTLPLPPGRYELRFAAERLGKTGNVFLSLDVPNFREEPFSLSGLLVEAPDRRGTFRTEAAAWGSPVIPTALRRFARGERVAAFMRIYQGASHTAKRLSITTSIRNEQDVSVTEETQRVGPEAFASGQGWDYRFTLPTAKLQPGSYLLTISVAGDGAAVTRALPFSIQ